MERLTSRIPRQTVLDEVWLYVAKNGDVALSLDFPVYARRGGAVELGTKAITFHRAFPQMHEPEPARACEWVAGGKCYGHHTGYGWAEEVWKHATDPTGFEQGESFWLALEQELRETAARERLQAVGIDGEGI